MIGLIPAHAGKTWRGVPTCGRGPAHPRSRGENLVIKAKNAQRVGSSPLTRGKRRGVLDGRIGGGLIPAHAGKTPSTPRCCRESGAHPRSRGENLGEQTYNAIKAGSSPLTRGKLRAACGQPWRGGLIPAHAGKTAWTSSGTRSRPAHPRSRGENPRSAHVCLGTSGSSPLTRGKPAARSSLRPVSGLIPAHAGKTILLTERKVSAWAHPRSRGENLTGRQGLGKSWGSSPLTRGKQTRWALSDLEQRLIPAHAGKTGFAHGVFDLPRAHPRSRGENIKTGLSENAHLGSSPLTRGKPSPRRDSRPSRRLIPAHAGKTVPDSRDRFPCRAHPRSRGENTWAVIGFGRAAGSSPLTRGKQVAGSSPVGGAWLIPAHAGKTRDEGAAKAAPRAHPRSRGENWLGMGFEPRFWGSSPLTRGKRDCLAVGLRNRGLIPAHAGKTVKVSVVAETKKAHPRSRGENWEPMRAARVCTGSSPLTRGKRGRAAGWWVSSGLIPAHAGKTSTYSHTRAHPRAHPRSRGENKVIGQGYSGAWGSSPLTRGKQVRKISSLTTCGLIPAHAGKTCSITKERR